MEASKFLRLNWRDLGQGIVVAILIVVGEAILNVLKAQGFIGLAQMDWGQTLDLAVKAAAAFLFKNLFSDEDGRVFGKI
jgi:Ca2+/Na+ antiporter